MRYVSIDIETTGLNPGSDQVLEIAAIIDDLEIQASLDVLPTFHAYVLYEMYYGNVFALAMNARILKILAEGTDKDIIPCKDVITTFSRFLLRNGFYDKEKITAAGKNFASFDRQFLERLPNSKLVQYHHRSLDPTILYLEPAMDVAAPNMELCLERAGIAATNSHQAIDDAQAVIKLLRKKFPLDSGVGGET